MIGKKRFPILMLTRWYLFLMTNILCNFVPHETVLLDDRDPPWMNKEIKKLINEKKFIFNCFHWNNNNKQSLDRLKDLQTQLNFLIEKPKGKYYSRITSKLQDIGGSSKTYWSILKSSFIGKKFHLLHCYLKKRWIYYRFQGKSRIIQFIFCKPVLLN